MYIIIINEYTDMQNGRQKILYVVIAAGSLLILITLLSLIYDVHFWFLKVLDFPRMQVFIALIVVAAFFGFLNKTWKTVAFLFSAGLLISLFIQATFIFPYTPLVQKAVKTADLNKVKKDRIFSLLVSNVWMKNKDSDAFLNVVSEADPDILIAMETNAWWQEQLQSLSQAYPYHKLYPLDNTYGMLLYSKFPLRDVQVKFLSKDKVPSIHTKVILPDGAAFQLHAIHPVPPKPSKYPDNVGEEEVALLKVGNMVGKDKLPVIVAGDFNDVAWSNTSRLFGRESSLHDVRVGRWLYNSFDATSFVFRWPLDHVYVSDEFELIDIKRLNKVGSDHFPVYVKLVLTD
ncbi:MAG: endonuclease/exonuclease/phosphatase family protein [Hymenobacteraceae bacterium]|nr:endonuclease/exonuclease/phosphatase family protein [Hymenobacteraceae bacterium]MDX5398070.1 endonuclease/exonuclease/phosphatase family protein [Hymenobacteraceae bacterium]MDX5514141.1 endonuclease/exonuclease/phosphatase family protein [Hymenobacteraceae bacterium]